MDNQTKTKVLAVVMLVVDPEVHESVSNVEKKIIWLENAQHLIVNI